MKTSHTLYSRLALITSITLVMGYAFVYAAYNLSTESANTPLTSTKWNSVINAVNGIDSQVNSLSGAVASLQAAGGSLWSAVTGGINYTAGTVGIGSTTGTNAELQIQSGTKPHWGIYQHEASEELRFWNGSNNVTFSKNGNVGIGTSLPSGKLTLWEPTASAIQELRMDGNNSSIHRLSWDLWNKYLEYSQANGSISFANATTSDFVIKNTGNVGIGTASPWTRLHLYESTASAIQSLLMDGAGSTKHRLLWNGGRYLEYSQATGDITLHSNGGDFVLNNLGNVGIWTTSPGTKLHVLWNNEMARFETTSDGANQYAQIAILAPGGANYIWSNNNNSPWYYGGNGALNIYTGQASPIAFFTNGSYQRMTIAGNGNVMIGTTTDAGYKLDVNGSIRWTTVTPSDRNLKKNIQTLLGALGKIEELRGVTYEWKDSSKWSGSQVGVIAQEVEQIFPELVNTDKQGVRAVNYSALIAPLIEAVKELKSQKDSEIQELKKENNKLSQENQEIKSLVCLDHLSATICQ